MAAPIPSEQAALLRAIVANPDDDTTRLVYADWLQENGDTPQAGFIRVSITLAGMKKTDKKWPPFAKRLREIAEAHGKEWLDALGLAAMAVDRYHRGFPLRVRFTGANEFFADAETMFAFLPIRKLKIPAFNGRFDTNSLPRLAAMPELAPLTHLWLHDHEGINPESWRELFRSPHLSGLTFLSLAGNGISDEQVEELASAPPLAGLTDLDLSYNAISVDGLRAIIESPHLTKLKNLWLERTDWLSDSDYWMIEHGDIEDADGNDVLAALYERLGQNGLHLYRPPEDKEDLI